MKINFSKRNFQVVDITTTCLVERKKEADLKFQSYPEIEDEICISFELESLTGIPTEDWNGTAKIEISSFDGRSQSTPFFPGIGVAYNATMF